MCTIRLLYLTFFVFYFCMCVGCDVNVTPYCLVSEIEGTVTRNGKPLSHVEVVQRYDWVGNGGSETGT